MYAGMRRGVDVLFSRPCGLTSRKRRGNVCFREAWARFVLERREHVLFQRGVGTFGFKEARARFVLERRGHILF